MLSENALFPHNYGNDFTESCTHNSYSGKQRKKEQMGRKNGDKCVPQMWAA